MREEQMFKSSYFLRLLGGDFNPFTPNVISIDNDHIEYKRRNWYLISVDSETLHFQNITGISVDKHLFGATLRIKSTGNDSIFIHGFWKKKANEIKAICFEQIAANTQKGTTEMMAGAISSAVGHSNETAYASVADELLKLKSLFDRGVLSQDEFEKLKKRLIE